MEIHFGCTHCGRCCHDLKLPLSVDEAIVWASRGHAVHLLVEGLPWTGDAQMSEPRAVHDRNRSFAGACGDIAIRVAAILVAWHQGACPYLLPGLRCGDYADRPRICRIYPLMARPFEPFDTANRLCPPEAWNGDLPLLMTDAGIAEPVAAQVLADYRDAALADVPVIAAACAMLGVTRAGFANEGFAVVAPDPADLADALRRARREATPPPPRAWTYVTNRRATLTMLAEAGCVAELVPKGADYLGSFADAPDAD